MALWVCSEHKHPTTSYFANVGVPAVQPSAVHSPVKRSTRQTCDQCRQGTTGYVCAACGKQLQIKCFVAVHDM